MLLKIALWNHFFVQRYFHFEILIVILISSQIFTVNNRAYFKNRLLLQR